MSWNSGNYGSNQRNSGSDWNTGSNDNWQAQNDPNDPNLSYGSTGQQSFGSNQQTYGSNQDAFGSVGSGARTQGQNIRNKAGEQTSGLGGMGSQTQQNEPLNTRSSGGRFDSSKKTSGTSGLRSQGNTFNDQSYDYPEE